MQAVRKNVDAEKSQAALTSVLAAVGLTVFKIIVGFMTGSLGILAEAAHSGLDLVAALVTFFAVLISGKPPDREHLYGHGKVENLSALFETFLLLVTCVWIFYEGFERLFRKTVEVEASFWAFLIMGVSIFIDYNRSRMLYRVAEKHKSQALEADALHFHTDIWSSSVVIIGLICVKLSDFFPGLEFLHKADALSAIAVALIVVYVSLQLGRRTVEALLDAAPRGVAERIIEEVRAMPGVVDCHNVRVRHSGPDLFVDAHVLVDGQQTLEQAHQLTEEIERTIARVVPDADVTVHPEPYAAAKRALPGREIFCVRRKIFGCQGQPLAKGEPIAGSRVQCVEYSGPPMAGETQYATHQGQALHLQMNNSSGA